MIPFPKGLIVVTLVLVEPFGRTVVLLPWAWDGEDQFPGIRKVDGSMPVHHGSVSEDIAV